jgi:hypothetical protein
LRGPSRAAALERLRELDLDLIAAARESATETELAELARAAEVELAPFAARMPADAFARAVASARDHLLRDRLGLPTLAME